MDHTSSSSHHRRGDSKSQSPSPHRLTPKSRGHTNATSDNRSAVSANSPRHNSHVSYHKASARTDKVTGSRVQKSNTKPSSHIKIAKAYPAAGANAIRIIINNRLGTRNEILCSPSDTISDFKKLAALHIGVKPEAITLKRQGERPLKNSLTLADYEVGNGACLDYEVDTTD
ncbi:MAG: hypothetical protein Q9201_001274 [Fulgogasparrea decipioides]